MKHLITCLALGIAFAAGAQTGLVEFPYNPDSNGDDMIGTADLLDLLSLFGNEFSEEGTYLSADSTTALYYAGNFDYAMCLHQCSNLSGEWHIPSRKKFCQVIHPSESLVTGEAWLNQPGSARYTMAYGREIVLEVGYPNDSEMYDISAEGNGQCFCFTHERPKVEYTYCVGDWESGIQECVDEKVQDGWYPMGGISGHSGLSGTNLNWQFIQQAFWRWAE